MAEPNTIIDSAVTAASAGGGFAGVLLAVRWVLNWLTGRWDARAARIDAQDAKVDLQWREIREALTAEITNLRGRVEKLEREGHAVLLAYQHVSGALIRLDPKNEALERAGHILSSVFPIDLPMMVARAEAALDADEERRAGK